MPLLQSLLQFLHQKDGVLHNEKTYQITYRFPLLYSQVRQWVNQQFQLRFLDYWLFDDEIIQTLLQWQLLIAQ